MRLLQALCNYCIHIMTTRVKRGNKRPGHGETAELNTAALGRRIRELRGFDIDQREFARSLGVSQSQLSKYERGGSVPPLEVLVRLAKRAGKTLDWLILGREDN